MSSPPTAAQLVEQLGWSLPNGLREFGTKDALFMTLAKECVRIDSQLIEYAQRIRRYVDLTEDSVTRGGPVNDLGELQQTGLRFDQLCATRRTAYNALETVIRHLTEE
jgi:hypothetical protein